MPSWLVTRAESALAVASYEQSKACSLDDIEWALHLPVGHEINVTTEYR
jgi:hypothetical protein